MAIVNLRASPINAKAVPYAAQRSCPCYQLGRLKFFATMNLKKLAMWKDNPSHTTGFFAFLFDFYGFRILKKFSCAFKSVFFDRLRFSFLRTSFSVALQYKKCALHKKSVLQIQQ